MMRLWSVPALALAACGNGTAERLPATEVIAQQFLASPQPPAPTPELAAELEALNSCTARLIRASDISYDSSQDEITAKVRDFMKRCSAKKSGSPKG